MHNLLFIGKSVLIDYMSKLDYGKRCGIIVVLFGLGVAKGTVMQLAAGVISYMETTIKATYLFRSLWKWECFSFAHFSCLWIWKTEGHFSLAGQGQGPRKLRPLGFVFDRIVSTVASQVQTSEQIDVRVHSTRVSTCTKSRSRGSHL